MNLNLRRLLLLLLTVSIISCQRDLQLQPEPQPNPQPPDTVITEPPPTPVVPPDNYILTSVHGEIADENGSAMQGVMVQAGNKSAMTNEYGIFRIADVTVPEHATFIKAEKAGYFTGSRTIVSTPGGNGFVKIKMMRRQLKSSFNAEDGATVVINDNASVEIGGAAVTADGKPYQGTVKAYAAVINPEAQDFNETMPGDLRGLNTDSQFTALKSYGMITVELETEAGAPLQLAENKPAVIKMKVPSSLTSSAPAQIPLWHFNATDGLWREQGLATLNNGWYSGTVSHFSTWNYDDPSAFVFVTLRVRGMKGRIRPYSRVKIIDKTTETFSDLYTDSAGYIRTWVLKGSPLEVQVLNTCGEVMHSQAQPALSSDADLGTVQVDRQSVLVTGSVHDCNDQPVSQGYATLAYQGLNYTTEINSGGIEFYLDRCDAAPVDAYLYFFNSSFQTEAQAVQLSGQNQDIGVFIKCDPADTLPGDNEYVAYKIGTDSILSQGARSIITYTGFTNGDTLTRINFTHRMYDVGAFDITVQFRDSSVHTSTIYNPSNLMLYTVDYIPVSPLMVNVKEYGPVGGEVYLTFTGTYKNTQTNEIVPLVGEMRVVRKE